MGGRNAPRERARLSLARPAAPAGRAEEGRHPRQGGREVDRLRMRVTRSPCGARGHAVHGFCRSEFLRRLPLCRCECASRAGWVVGGTEGPCSSRKAGDSTSETELCSEAEGGGLKAGAPESGLQAWPRGRAPRYSGLLGEPLLGSRAHRETGVRGSPEPGAMREDAV